MRDVAPTRHSVVEAAREWLDGRDPGDVTPREVARALGMVPTAMYRYFDSAEDMQAALRGPNYGSVQPPVVRRAPVTHRTDDAHHTRFVQAFIARAAGPEQASILIKRLVGDTITVGPEPVGPKGRATAFATGLVGTVDVADRGDGSMIVTIPAALTIDISLGRRWSKQFATRIAVPLHITPTIVDSLQLQIGVRRPQPRDLVVDVELSRMSVAVLQAVGNIDGLLRERIIEFIDGVLDSPEGQAATRVDLGRVIDDAWDSGLVFPEPT